MPKPTDNAEQEADGTSQQFTDEEIIDREASGENTSDDQTGHLPPVKTNTLDQRIIVPTLQAVCELDR